MLLLYTHTVSDQPHQQVLPISNHLVGYYSAHSRSNLLTFEQGCQYIHLLYRRLQPLADQRSDLIGFRQAISRVSILVLEPTNVEVVATFGNLLACKAAEAPFFALLDTLTSAVVF